ncbi:MAG TPA: hypothetical protein VGI19_03815 [Candidatus Cybelea sp.]|jgi:hypothetical protein
MGFEIEEPCVFVNWGISEARLLALFEPRTLKRVTEGYYAMPCQSLGGLRHELGFHFEPRKDGRLVYLEFFRKHYEDLAVSFNEFQEHVESHFGPATSRLASWIGLPAFHWKIDDVEIWHYALDRFGPEEHLAMRSDGKVPTYWKSAVKV